MSCFAFNSGKCVRYFYCAPYKGLMSFLTAFKLAIITRGEGANYICSNSFSTGPVKTRPILEYYFQVVCKFHIFGSVHAMHVDENTTIRFSEKISPNS
jgi:hypothetical protein